MALSNKFGALVLTTGNKSEMSTGYCTLYGDMVGALAVIGDVFKTRVYALSRYANRDREIIPQNTIAKPPSAELRPGQKDTDSLPPYDILDPILEAYVERYETAEQILAHLNQQPTSDNKQQTNPVDLDLIRRVLSLVERSEYKRQQAAPILKALRKKILRQRPAVPDRQSPGLAPRAVLCSQSQNLRSFFRGLTLPPRLRDPPSRTSWRNSRSHACSASVSKLGPSAGIRSQWPILPASSSIGRSEGNSRRSLWSAGFVPSASTSQTPLSLADFT